MELLVLLLLRLFLWVGVPLLLIALAVGPGRSWRFLRRGWSWLTERRQEPAGVLSGVVKEHERGIKALRDLLRQAEATLAEIVRNPRRSEENIPALEGEARAMA